MTGRFDGGLGLFLKGDGKGGFTPLSAAQSGLPSPVLPPRRRLEYPHADTETLIPRGLGFDAAGVVLGGLDFPMSLAVDTIALPYTIPMGMKRM